MLVCQNHRLGPKLIAAAILLAGGCHRETSDGNLIQLTSSSTRAARRAYAGAPPVIAHRPLQADCTTCHTAAGLPVPGLGFAPANPHARSRVSERVTNCRQCHLFQRNTTTLVANRFAPDLSPARPTERAFPGGPPVIPHRTFLRDNCLACHAGPAARPEIRCSHPDRQNCLQCHLVSDPLATPPQSAALATTVRVAEYAGR